MLIILTNKTVFALSSKRDIAKPPSVELNTSTSETVIAGNGNYKTKISSICNISFVCYCTTCFTVFFPCFTKILASHTSTTRTSAFICHCLRTSWGRCDFNSQLYNCKIKLLSSIGNIAFTTGKHATKAYFLKRNVR